MDEVSGRGKLPPRDVRKTDIAFRKLRREGIVTRTFSAKEIERVRRYLIHLGADATWRRIAKGDLVGYTIMVHENAELAYFYAKGVNPFNYRDFVAHWEEAHASALVEEHKVHQRLALETLGYNINIATLVARNAIVDKRTREDDLVLLKRFTDHKSVREKDIPKADDYYRKLLRGVIG